MKLSCETVFSHWRSFHPKHWMDYVPISYKNQILPTWKVATSGNTITSSAKIEISITITFIITIYILRLIIFPYLAVYSIKIKTINIIACKHASFSIQGDCYFGYDIIIYKDRNNAVCKLSHQDWDETQSQTAI